MAQTLSKTYEVVPVAITKTGKWLSTAESTHYLLEGGRLAIETPLSLPPPSEALPDYPLDLLKASDTSVVVFPLVHGTKGEDGTIAGFLELLHLPYVGSGVLSAALGMDKDFSKRVLASYEIPVVPYVVVLRGDPLEQKIPEIESTLSYPLFVKPSGLGSSVGVSKAKSASELQKGIETALHLGRKVLVEKAIIGHEIECSVLGDLSSAKASVLGELIPPGEFYDYEAKYIDENGADLEVPAKLSAPVARRVQPFAILAFKIINL